MPIPRRTPAEAKARRRADNALVYAALQKAGRATPRQLFEGLLRDDGIKQTAVYDAVARLIHLGRVRVVDRVPAGVTSLARLLEVVE